MKYLMILTALLTKSALFATEVTSCDIRQIKGITDRGIYACQDLKGSLDLLQVSHLTDVCKNEGPYPFAGVTVVDVAVVLITFNVDELSGVCIQDQAEIKMNGLSVLFPDVVVNELAKKALVRYINSWQ